MPDVIVESDGPIGTVRLNRPDRANSVTPEVVAAMGNGVAELADSDGVRAVVLTGTGSTFCAGADVQEMHAVYRSDGADGLMDYLADVWMPAVQTAVRGIWNAPVPVVAAINGAATAGGLDFSLACDARIAASTARFAESYVNLGMVPVAGGAYLLPAVVGLPAATPMLASGELVDAGHAERIGLVGEVCDPGELPARARSLAEQLSQGPAATFASLKQVLRTHHGAGFEQALQDSYRTNVDLIARPEVRDRIVAIMEKYSATHAAH